MEATQESRFGGLSRSDMAVAAYILCAVLFFIIPIPSFLLDIMLAVNLSVALIIMMNTLFVKEVLDMSFFPTMLLFATLLILQPRLRSRTGAFPMTVLYNVL